MCNTACRMRHHISIPAAGPMCTASPPTRSCIARAKVLGRYACVCRSSCTCMYCGSRATYASHVLSSAATQAPSLPSSGHVAHWRWGTSAAYASMRMIHSSLQHGRCTGQHRPAFSNASPACQRVRHRSVCARARASARLPDALLFDCDGVLVDTEKDGHRISFNEAFKRTGRAARTRRGYACSSASAEDRAHRCSSGGA